MQQKLYASAVFACDIIPCNKVTAKIMDISKQLTYTAFFKTEKNILHNEK